MNSVVVNAISVSVILIGTGRTYNVVEYPSVWIVSLDGRLHVQHAAEHVTQITIQTLNILAGIRYGHVVLVRVRVNKTCAELHELGVHGVVYTSCVTLKVRTSTFQSTFLIIVIKTYIICIINATTAEVYAVVLTDTSLEGLVEPVGVSIVLEVVKTVGSLAVTTRNRNSCVLGSNTQVLAVLVGIHDVVSILLNLVNTHVSFIVNLQWLLLLTALGSDNYHTVSSS